MTFPSLRKFPAAVFLDRDGVIVQEGDHLHRVEDLALIEGSLTAMRRLNEAGIPICIVTNQAGIAKGLYTEEQYFAFSDEMIHRMRRQKVEVLDIRHCPHHPEGVVPRYTRDCDCRKPGTALLDAALAEHGWGARDCVLIGDKNSDIEAGLRLGMRTYLVETGHGRDHRAQTRAQHVVSDLAAAVAHLLSSPWKTDNASLEMT